MATTVQTSLHLQLSDLKFTPAQRIAQHSDLSQLSEHNSSIRAADVFQLKQWCHHPKYVAHSVSGDTLKSSSTEESLSSRSLMWWRLKPSRQRMSCGQEVRPQMILMQAWRQNLKRCCQMWHLGLDCALFRSLRCFLNRHDVNKQKHRLSTDLHIQWIYL